MRRDGSASHPHGLVHCAHFTRHIACEGCSSIYLLKQPLLAALEGHHGLYKDFAPAGPH